MKYILLILLLVTISCSWKDKATMFTEKKILHELDLAFKGIPGEYFPEARPQDVRYNFFLDLEHGYCETAGNRIHLYADDARWAIVFEKSGYQKRGSSVEIELNYIGNCIQYPIDKYPDIHYITNASSITLIEPEELARIENKVGTEAETFELIGQSIKQIKVRDMFIPFDNDYRNYEKVGVKVREYNNPNKLIAFGDLVRYLN